MHMFLTSCVRVVRATRKDQWMLQVLTDVMHGLPTDAFWDIWLKWLPSLQGIVCQWFQIPAFW